MFPIVGLGALAAHAPSGVATSWWSLVAFTGYGVTLVAVHALVQPGRRARSTAGGLGRLSYGRRRALAALGAGGVTIVTGTMLWRVIGRIGEKGTPPAPGAVADDASRGEQDFTREPVGLVPTPGDAPASDFEAPDGISRELTLSDQFYVVSKNLIDPEVAAGDWFLEVTGMVASPLRLSYGDLLALPTVDQLITLECISNPVGGTLISTARWTGVPLAWLLERAGIHAGADQVIFSTVDNYRESLPLDRARLPTTLLAHTMNGRQLGAKHGFPVRLLTTGLYGMKNPKWLSRIEVTSTPIRGYWQRSGWNPDRGVEAMARFDTRPEQVRTGTTVLLGGVAFTGDRGVSRVEVSTDGGTTWSPAMLKPPLSPWTWVLWSYRWQVQRPDRYTLLVRAVDGAGATQSEVRRRSYPTGATGYHTIEVHAF
jgi:DMSO/TMAO reductase YedYZ molybdopterin-dependent catalytic subunit